MKQRITLLALSLLALAFAPPIGFRTANTKSHNPAAKAGDQTPPKTEIELLCEAAGVDPKNVIHRIRPGLTAKQAIEVAVNEKLERGG